jgi:hypothetical protein
VHYFPQIYENISFSPKRRCSPLRRVDALYVRLIRGVRLTFRWVWNAQLLADEFAEVIIQFRMTRQNGAFAIVVVHVLIVPGAVFNKTTALTVQVVYKLCPFHAKTSSSSSIISPCG